MCQDIGCAIWRLTTWQWRMSRVAAPHIWLHGSGELVRARDHCMCKVAELGLVAGSI